MAEGQLYRERNPGNTNVNWVQTLMLAGQYSTHYAIRMPPDVCEIDVSIGYATNVACLCVSLCVPHLWHHHHQMYQNLSENVVIVKVGC